MQNNFSLARAAGRIPAAHLLLCQPAKGPWLLAFRHLCPIAKESTPSARACAICNRIGAIILNLTPSTFPLTVPGFGCTSLFSRGISPFLHAIRCPAT
jgi:hypothetical protein